MCSLSAAFCPLGLPQTKGVASPRVASALVENKKPGEVSKGQELSQLKTMGKKVVKASLFP